MTNAPKTVLAIHDLPGFGRAALSVIVLLAFVVPQFQRLFADAGKALPLATQIVIAVGEGAKASLSAFDHLIRSSAPA